MFRPWQPQRLASVFCCKITAAACGADGLMIEVHNNPAAALCDGPQSITPEEFERVVKTVNAVRAAVNLHNMAAPSAVRTAEDVIRVCAS